MLIKSALLASLKQKSSQSVTYLCVIKLPCLRNSFVYKMQDNDILKLIISVKNHPKLYTNLAQNYENDIQEWTAVAQECGMSIRQAQDQWDFLMNNYMEYLKNNQDFSFAQHMDFLQPHFFAINDQENIDEMELLNAIGSKNFEEADLANEELKENDQSKLEIYFGTKKETKAEKVKNTKTQTTTHSKNNESEINYISSATEQGSSVTNMSSLELIFLGYAKQLQKMPLAWQILVKRKIAEIMAEAELQMMAL